MSTRVLPFPIDMDRLAAFCRERGIARLTVFGSVLRDDFDPDHSDIDVLADFAEGALDGVGLRYFTYGPVLSELFGQRVDFCSQLRPWLLDEVRREGLVIYDAT